MAESHRCSALSNPSKCELYDLKVRSQIDTLVILDRAVDLVSPLPIQLTYEGLIDEMFGIQCSSVRLPENKVVSLSSAEELYGELRGLNFNAVGPSLARKARSLAVAEGERHEARNVRELKQFVDKLPGMQVMGYEGDCNEMHHWFRRQKPLWQRTQPWQSW